jgi:hypothetical protein
MKEIILHIGFHKTATSSFQATCARNRTTLLEKGFFFPVFSIGESEIGNHGIPLVSLFSDDPRHYHFNMVQGLSDKIEAVNAAYAEQLERVLRMHDRIIFSGEDISALSMPRLILLRDHFASRGFSLRVLCAVRRPYSYTCSLLQQQIQGGVLSDLSKVRVPTKSVRIRKLQTVFENIEFFSYEQDCQHQHGPVGALLQRIGVDSLDDEYVKVNEGIGNLTTRLYASINGRYPIIHDGALNELGRMRAVARFDSDRFLLTAREVEAIKEELDKENQQLGSLLGSAFMDTEYKTSKPLIIGRELALEILANACRPVHIADAVVDFLVEHGDGAWKVSELFAPLMQASLLSAGAVDYLKEQALANERSNLPLAYELMTFAGRSRPDGAFIQEKLAEYQQALAAQAEVPMGARQG